MAKRSQANAIHSVTLTRMKAYHLPENELAELRMEHRRMKRLNNAKKADKVKAVYLLGSGWSISDICAALLIDDNTVYRYYDMYKALGINGLLKSKHSGRVDTLNKRELTLLDEYLQACPCRTTKQAIEFVKQEFDVSYSISGMNKLLTRLGFVYKKPQPIPGKYCAKAQQQFIKKYRKIRQTMQAGDSLFFMDGVHPHHNPTLQRGWFKLGSRVPVKTGTRFGRLNINAAVDIDTLDVISVNVKQLTQDTTLDFLFKLREKRPKGWIYLVLDNAGYYNTPQIREAAKKLAIKLLYLPPYSPNLNLIERLWEYMRKHFLYNRYFETLADFKQQCLRFMRNLRFRKDELRSLLTEKFQSFA